MNIPVISLERYEIDRINLKRNLSEEEKELEKDLKTDISCAFTDNYKNGKVSITVLAIDKISDRRIEVKVSGYFNINVEKNYEEFLAINGSAILFPYVRSAISMTSSLDSQEAILIPTFNIQELLKQKEVEENLDN